MAAREIPIQLRLKRAYGKIVAGILVMRKIVNEDSVRFFETQLNTSVPRTREEINEQRVFKDLFYTNKNACLSILRSEKDGEEKAAPYILWTDTYSILRFFELSEHISLDWDQVKHIYIAKVLTDSEKAEKASRVAKRQQTDGEKKPKYATPRQKAGKDRPQGYKDVSKKKSFKPSTKQSSSTEFPPLQSSSDRDSVPMPGEIEYENDLDDSPPSSPPSSSLNSSSDKGDIEKEEKEEKEKKEKEEKEEKEKKKEDNGEKDGNGDKKEKEEKEEKEDYTGYGKYDANDSWADD